MLSHLGTALTFPFTFEDHGGKSGDVANMKWLAKARQVWQVGRSLRN